jgi:hypothetical protein
MERGRDEGHGSGRGRREDHQISSSCMLLIGTTVPGYGQRGSVLTRVLNQFPRPAFNVYHTSHQSPITVGGGFCYRY